MKKIIFIFLPLIFTAQACNFLSGGSGEDQGSGSRGIFLSSDSGQTWEQAKETGKTQSLAGASVSQIVTEPGRPNNLLAATTNLGLYGSDDYGKNWAQLLPGVIAYSAFVSPNNPSEVFAAGARNKIAAVLKSPDRAKTWIQIYGEPKGEASVTSLVFDKNNVAIFYAGLSTGTMLKSQDFGKTWNALTDFSDRVVSLDLSSDSTMVYALCRVQGLKRSQNGGLAWSDVTLADKPDSYNDLVLDPTNATGLYLGTDKGLYHSLDGGTKWQKILLPATPEINNVSAAAVNPKNGRQIFAAIRSTIYKSDDSGQTWSVQTLPTARIISEIVIDPVEPNRIIVGLK